MIKSKIKNNIKREKHNPANLLLYIFISVSILIIIITFFNPEEKNSFQNSLPVNDKYNNRILSGEGNNEKNEIKLVIDKALGTKIINNSFKINISEIIVNGHNQSEINVDLANSNDLVDGLNNITIKFKKNFTTCFQMFYELKNILSADL